LVRLIATDLMYAAPAEVAPGLTHVRLVNDGKVSHEASIVRLDAGATVESYLTEARAGKDWPDNTVEMGGPGLVIPGDSSEVVLDLRPGRYAILCWADKHVLAGMIQLLTVTGTAAAAVAPPPTAIEIALKEFTFDFSGSLRAGSQVVKLSNVGAKPHEFVVFRFQEGKTLQDFGAWFATREGDPPAYPVGGATSMAPGREVWLSLTLPPGRYFVACGVPEGDTIHASLGMLNEFEIQ